MTALPDPAAHHRAESALNDFHDYYAQTAEGEGTDVDFLWSVSSALADALTETLLALSKHSPEQRRSIHDRLARILLHAIERRAEAEPALADEFVESEVFRDVVAELPESALVALLRSSRRGVRTTVIAALRGLAAGEAESEPEEPEPSLRPGDSRPR